LLGLVSVLAPVIAGGNTAVVLASENLPLCAVTFAEVIHSSDVPGGVVNILTGTENELIEHMGSHMDVNAVCYAGGDSNHFQKIQQLAASSVKRVRNYTLNWSSDESENPYLIQDFQEVKTTWHPIEHVGGATSSY
jgi:acyl-CoA reductase-like NAD-dependent aldehyde dehydrogenase